MGRKAKSARRDRSGISKQPSKKAASQPSKNSSVGKKSTPKKKIEPSRRNPFFRLDGKQPAFDLIIPLSNSGFSDFSYRVDNLNTILNDLPAQVHVVLVEQIVNSQHPTYREKLNIGSQCRHKWVTVNYPVFNKSWLNNIGAKNSITNQLLFSEADVALEKNYFAYFQRWLGEKKFRWCIAWNRIVFWEKDRVSKKASHRPFKGGPEGGVVYMSKPFFWQIGGYNEWMQKLGGIDNEIIRRAEAVDRRSGYFGWTIDHLWHPYHRQYKQDRQRTINKGIYKQVAKNPSRAVQFCRRFVSQAGSKVPLCKNRKWSI